MPEFKRRSLLFVPGNNERMLRKSISPSVESDYVIFDLEDAVPLHQKQKAREMILEVLKESRTEGREGERKRYSARINNLVGDEKMSEEDVRVLAKDESITSFIIPKAEDENRIEDIFRRTGKRTIPLIESAKGFLKLEQIATRDGVEAISYGAADMALSMKGSVRAFRSSETIRTMIALVSRSHGLDPIDQVFFELEDLESFRKEAIEARDLGYTGKLLIHPSQVSVANMIFSTPSADDLDWATRVVDAYEKALRDNGGRGAIRLDGRLVDAVHYKIAKEVLKSSPPSAK